MNNSTTVFIWIIVNYHQRRCLLSKDMCLCMWGVFCCGMRGCYHFKKWCHCVPSAVCVLRKLLSFLLKMFLCVCLQLLRAPVLPLSGGWAAARSPTAPSPSPPSPPARRTCPSSTHASSAPVHTHLLSFTLTRTGSLGHFSKLCVTDVSLSLQGCGPVWLPPSPAAPSSVRCCWLTSTRLVPRPSSTPTSTHCKKLLSFSLCFMCKSKYLTDCLCGCFSTQRGLHGEVCDEQLLWDRPGCKDLPGVQQQERGASREVQVRHMHLSDIDRYSQWKSDVSESCSIAYICIYKAFLMMEVSNMFNIHK